MHRLNPTTAAPPSLEHEQNEAILHQPFHHGLLMPSNWLGQYPPHMNRTVEQLNPWNPYNRYGLYSNPPYAAYHAYGERAPDAAWSDNALQRNERFFSEPRMRPPRPNERSLSTSPPTPFAPFSPHSPVAVDPSQLHKRTENIVPYACTSVPFACESLPVVISSDEDGEAPAIPTGIRIRRSEKRRRSGNSPLSDPNSNFRRENGTNSAKILCRQYDSGQQQQQPPHDDLMPLELVSPTRRLDRIPINLSGKKLRSSRLHR